MTRKQLNDDEGVNDALELLGDPISNLFGCILFIALLVALMTSSSSDAVASGAIKVDPDIPRAELARVRAAARVGELERSLAALEDVNKTLAVDGVGDMAKVVAKLTSGTASLKQRLQAREALLASIKKNPASPTQTLDAQVRAMGREIADIEHTLKTMEQSHTIEAKLPVMVAMVNRKQRILIFKNGQGHYFANSYQDKIEGLVSVPHRERIAGNSMISDKFEFTQETGISLADLANPSSPAMRALLTASNNGFVDAYVYPDSIHAFHAFKRVMDQHNRRIGIYTHRADEVVVFQTSSGVHLAQ